MIPDVLHLKKLAGNDMIEKKLTYVTFLDCYL